MAYFILCEGRNERLEIVSHKSIGGGVPGEPI
jgi:hypothetical protein